MSERLTAENDVPKGCPVMVWDGPYKHRCGLGATVGRCAYHGPFDPNLIRPIPPARTEEAPDARD